MEMRLRNGILFLVLIFLLPGCSYLMSLDSVKKDMDKPWFQEKLNPPREIQVLILSNEPDKDLEEVIAEASDEMMKQTGMRLNIIGYASIDKTFVPSQRGALQILHEAAESPGVRYDLAITTWGVMGIDAMIPFVGVMFGAIDDVYRRYIILRVKTKFILLHEIFHAFIFDRVHGGCITNSGWTFPLGTRCYWLTERDWQETMKNKWRDFREPVSIPEELRWDIIKEKKPTEASKKQLGSTGF